MLGFCRACLALLLCNAVLLTHAQFGGMGMPPGRAAAKAVKSDVQYIECQVCELLAKNAYRQVKAKRDQLKPGKKLAEAEVFDLVERIANPNKDEGDWVSKVDLVESGSKLKVVEMEEVGKCGTECKTVQRAAEGILEYTDTDVAEKLWQGKASRSQFTNWLCYEATKVCSGKPPRLPKERKPGPAFEVADPQEAQMAKMMDSMKEMGMGGQMYDRDSMQQYLDTQDPLGEYDGEGEQLESGNAGEGGLLGKAAASAQDLAAGARDATASILGQAKEGVSKAFSGFWGSKATSQPAEPEL